MESLYYLRKKLVYFAFLIKKMMQYFLFIMYNIFCNILFIDKEGYDDVEYKSRNWKRIKNTHK